MATLTRKIGHTSNDTPPHSMEAEQGVLGSMMTSPQNAIPESAERIRPESFYIPAHQIIYDELVSMWTSGRAVDLITFTQWLRDKNLLERVGGAGFVTSLVTFVPTAANIEYYLDIVEDKRLARGVIQCGTEAVHRAYKETDNLQAMLDETEQAFFALRSDCKRGIISTRELVPEAIEMIEQAYERKGALTGISTGLHELDRMLGGLQKSEVIVIAGRPSMGKTALATNIAEHAAINEKSGVGIFSMEMSAQQLTVRMISSIARVNSQKLRDGFLSERDFPAMTSAASKIAEAPIYIDDESNMEIHAIRAKARKLKSEKNIGLLIIDYVQLAHANYKSKEDNRQREVTIISSQIKSMAKELAIPVLLISQLNRSPEGRGGKPRLGDLRESGSLEQDADVVLLLWRPEIYEEDEEVRAEKAGEAELIVAKQRNGPVGEVSLTFLREFARFEDRARNICNIETEI